jgi:hypothetical protein
MVTTIEQTRSMNRPDSTLTFPVIRALILKIFDDAFLHRINQQPIELHMKR